MQTLTATGFTHEAFEAFLAARQEPAWLTELRRQAWARFVALNLPSRKEEEWMRTDIRLFRFDKFGLPAGGGAVEAAASEAIPAGLLNQGVDLAGRAATVNSQHQVAQLAKQYADRGVIFGSLDTLVNDHPELVRKYLFQAVDSTVDKFAALHAACWSGGTLLYVPRNVRVDEPLHLLNALEHGQVDLAHQLVILDEGAEVTLLAETVGDEQAALHCGAIELFVGPRASLRYVNLQNWGRGTWHFAHQQAHVEQDGRLQWTIGALGSRLAKVNQHVALVGPRAEAQVNGVMFTEGSQHLSYHTLQHHRAAECRSDLLYKGALQDESRVVWRGMIKVDVGAQKTDGYQRNDNLMLSESSRADSIPGLEIEADDVRCTHGATAGRVDDQQVFYARCRGLTRNEAVRMIVAGFFQQVFDRITIESVRNALGEAIGRRIRNYD
ncbi:MAG: Fe-S cluster assembly protein SufD [Planctomycetes bacterium]|nr:Fe-S cluster assembly protein SufD [Planctomycetota bacterium]